MEALKRDRAGQHAIRINDQYRVCFVWKDSGPERVEICEQPLSQDRTAMLLPAKRPPTHPGEMLLDEFIRPLGLTQKEVASRTGISFVRLNEIVNGRRGVTPDTALRLARLFETSPEFWLNGQLAWDLWHVLQAPEAADIRKIRPVKKTKTASACIVPRPMNGEVHG